MLSLRRSGFVSVVSFAFLLLSSASFPALAKTTVTGVNGAPGAVGSPNGEAGESLNYILTTSTPDSEYILKGGNGGGNFSDGTPSLGGNGGDVNALMTLTSSASSNSTKISVTGGTGGDAVGVGSQAGAGGQVSSLVNLLMPTGATNAYVELTQTGGIGGRGDYNVYVGGGLGGNGADSILDNAVTIDTTGTKTITQRAVGGNVSGSNVIHAISAGNAYSGMTLLEEKAKITNITLEAQGGGVANYGTATVVTGGNAEAYGNLESESGGLYANVTAKGGRTSNTTSGNAKATLLGKALDFVLAKVIAVAGNFEYEEDGTYASGDQTGTVAEANGYLEIDRTKSTAAGGSTLAVEATGGRGGYGGDGGEAKATAKAIVLGTDRNNTLSVSVKQTGGQGGTQELFGNIYTGANGADSFLQNAAQGETYGTLSLTQFAQGGAADWNGDSGNATSIFNLTDTKAKSLTVNSTAFGGEAGSSNTIFLDPILGGSLKKMGRSGDASSEVNVSATASDLVITSRAVALGDTYDTTYDRLGPIGGQAYATAIGLNTGNVSVTAEGQNNSYTGPMGGIVDGVSILKAQDGVAPIVWARAESTNGGNATAKVINRGAQGGVGINGADAGDSASISLVNAAQAKTNGGAVWVSQEAYASRTSESETGKAGRAGAAYSEINLNDNLAGSLRATNITDGGIGASSIGGSSDGGAANSVVSLVSTKAHGGSSVSDGTEVKATGGWGGYIYTGTDLTNGGEARASYNADLVKKAYAVVTAVGGEGGGTKYRYNTDGGDGAMAFASGNLRITNPQNFNGQNTASTLQVVARGGEGGEAHGTGYRGGDGAEAVLNANASVIGSGAGNDLVIIGTQSGGAGGTGMYGADGGDGADSIVFNAIEGHTEGALSLTQKALAGWGGNSTAAVHGKAGYAQSVLNVTDGVAKSLTVRAEALAGATSVYDPFKYNYGKAFASTSAISTKVGANVTAYATATGSYIMDVGNKPALGKTFARAESYAEGLGIKNLAGASSMVSFAGSGDATSRSVMSDGRGNKVVTSSTSSVANDIAYAGSSAIAGGEMLNGGYRSGAYFSNIDGNIYPTKADGKAYTLNKLGDAKGTMTVVGSSQLRTTLVEKATMDASYNLSATYNFASLDAGNDLLFGMTSSSKTGQGFSSAVFSLTMDSKLLYSGSFTSVNEFETFFSKPLSLGAVSGSTSLTLAMSQVLPAYPTGTVYKPYQQYVVDFAFVTAVKDSITGGVHDVSNVPLPAGLPLFGVAVAGLGFSAKRRRMKKAA